MISMISTLTPQHPVTIEVNGTEYEGWISSDVSRSLEDIAGTFSCPISYLPDNEKPVINRQDEVVIKIAGVVVVTGYVLGADPFYSRTDIGFQVEGRDKAGDLAVCSAIHAGGQWLNATVQQIAEDLCKPFGIDVVVETEIGKPLKRFEIEQGETVAECIARAASYRAVMVTSNAAGELLLTNAGKRRAPVSLVVGEGGNVISMSPDGNDDERFSDYIIQGQGELNDSDKATAHQLQAKSTDPKIQRHLPYLQIADNSAELSDLQQQADHMARIRYAQSQRYTYTVEGWAAADETGTAVPFEINTLIPIYDSALGLDGEEWLIVSINMTCSRDNADVTDITVCPPEAYEQIAVTEPKPPVMQKDKNKSKKKKGKGKGKGKGDSIDWRPGQNPKPKTNSKSSKDSNIDWTGGR